MILSFSLLFFSWVLFPLILAIAAKIYVFKRTEHKLASSVSVIIAAHNEESNLETRIRNIFNTNFSGELEVIVIIDGETDNSLDVLESLLPDYDSLRWEVVSPQKGRANAHNLAANIANHDILVFTDAETKFSLATIDELLKPFSDDAVGFVSGVISWCTSSDERLGPQQSLYWKYEYFIRSLETTLGIYALGTGACCAVRKSLYKDIPPSGDVDFITPIDVILQKHKCIHSGLAISEDIAPESSDKELASRIRMTAKNFHGIHRRFGLAGAIQNPIVFFVICVHKYLRWFTPFFLISMLFFTLFNLETDLGILFFASQAIFYFWGFLGSLRFRIIGAASVYSFLLANLGFFIGVTRALFGTVPSVYVPLGQLKK